MVLRIEDEFGEPNEADRIWKAYEDVRDAMEPYHSRWKETIAYLDGEDQWMYLGKQLVDRRSPVFTSREKALDEADVRHNFLQGMYQTKIAASLQNEPQPVVSLAENSAKARAVGRVATARLTNHYYEKGLQEAYAETLGWAMVCNVGWLGVLWDRLGAEPVQVPKKRKDGSVVTKLKKQPIKLETGLDGFEEVEEPVLEWKYQGDLRYVSANPFDIFCEKAKRWRDVRWVVYRQFIEKKVLEDLELNHASEVECDADASDFVQLDDWEDREENGQAQELVTVLLYFEKVSKDYPNGRYLVTTKDFVLYEGDLPGRQLPFEPVYDVPTPWTLYGKSMFSQAISPQRSLNGVEKNLRTIARFHSSPKLAAEAGSIVDKSGNPTETISNDPDAILFYRGRKPEYVEAARVPTFLEQMPAHYYEGIQNIAGVHGFSMGASKSAYSGRQVQAHEAADMRKWAPTLISVANAFRKVCRLALELERLYAEPTIFFQTYGPNGSEADIATFRKDELTDGFTVRVDASALMPYNPELRRQQLVEMWQVGLIPDQATFWKMMRDGGMGRLLGDTNGSVQRALKEHDLMNNGQPVQAEWHEDHGVHLDEHLEFMRTNEWYDLPDETKALYRNHVTEHWTFQQPMNAANPVAAGKSPMPGLEQPMQGQPQENLAPVMNGAESQGPMPGTNSGQEAAVGNMRGVTG